MLRGIRQSTVMNIKNIPGWRTSRKIIIIECDDWGSIGMPSKRTYDLLLSLGIDVDKRPWNKYDTLENVSDLEQLFDVLNSVRDTNNKPAVMTSFTNVTNPDFRKIKSEGFTKYYYEKFPETLKRYNPEYDVFKLWKEGMDAGEFIPEFHGREHIAVNLWMEKLREGNEDLRTAFDQGFVTMNIPGLPAPARGFRAAFYFTSEKEKSFLIDSINEGVDIFREIFGYTPRVFAPPNGIFHPDFDNVLAKTGVKFLYTGHRMPYPADGGKLKYKWFHPGQKGPEGLTYYTRNCGFEPIDNNYKGIELTIKQISAAFTWGKPANISTHRVNFAGGLNSQNRTNGLKELKILLKAIVKRWPDAEFMSSGEAHEYMRKSN